MKKLFSALAIIILLNAIPITLAISLGYDRGLIGLESLFLIFFIALEFKYFALIYGLGLFAAEIIYGISQAYPLFEAHQLIEVIEFIPNANKNYIFLLGIYFLISIITIFLSIKLAKISGKISLLSFITILSVLSTFEMLNNFSHESEKLFIFNQTLIGSVYFSLDGTRRFANTEAITENENTPFSIWPHNNVAKEIWKDNNLPKKILFIIVESWGMPINREEYIKQVEEIKNSKNIEIIKEGVVKYGGGTSVAELRELCKIYPHSFAFRKIPENLSKDCLPNKLYNEGRHTIALHAASGHMYHRDMWYPEIGFKENYFFDNPISKANKCFSFPGYCDVDLMKAIKNKIIKEKSIFFYWLTLNSHIPYDPRDLKNRDDKLCQKLNINKKDRCIHFQLIKEFFKELSENFNDREIADLHIILVGDHSPPFLGINIREFFSKEDMVPFLYLKIKDDMKANK